VTASANTGKKESVPPPNPPLPKRQRNRLQQCQALSSYTAAAATLTRPSVLVSAADYKWSAGGQCNTRGHVMK
jgi:hypothetical protein